MLQGSDRERGGRPPSFVVVGTSSGGVTALARLFKDLPADFPGALLVVIHVPENANKSWLPEQLTDRGHIPVKAAEDGETIVQGTAYIAPACTHLLVEGTRLRLGTGPREHYVRPSIDALFRTAASAFGRGAIGVILTGVLSDGALGLRAIRDAGGITIVQNPEEAEQGEMPRNAMVGLGVDYCLDLAEIGPLLDLLVRRAGPHKEGVLETGLASAVRVMKDRARLLRKLYAQSHGNSETATFLRDEAVALEKDIKDVAKLIRFHRGRS